MIVTWPVIGTGPRCKAGSDHDKDLKKFSRCLEVIMDRYRDIKFTKSAPNRSRKAPSSAAGITSSQGVGSILFKRYQKRY